MSTEQILLTAVGAILVAVLSFGGVTLGHLWSRVQNLEDQVKKARSQNRGLWRYCRDLLDLYYKHRTPGSPDPGPLPDVD